MEKVEQYTVHGKTTQFTTIDNITRIEQIIEENDQFHDGTVENIGHDSECTTIGFKHYLDPEHKIQRLIFTGNVELELDLDLLIRYISEINYEIGERVAFYFDGTGISVKADSVKMVIQELLN